MFSRRHPYLFFILSFSAIVASVYIVSTLLGLAGRGLSKFSTGEKVGVVELKGVISDSGKFIKHLKEFRKNKGIKAIVVRVDSPGGGVGPSQEIYREIVRTRKTKKVVASMGSVAASGGYYAACATDGIMASPGTITGSIGVIMGYTNFGAILKKIGLVPVVIKGGDLKDMGSPVREMTEKERKILQGFVDDIHRQFIEDVAAGRNLPVEKVVPLADGRIFSGRDALALGMVDRMGNLEDAVRWAGELAGVKGEPEAVYPKEDGFPLMKYLEARVAERIGSLVAESSGLRADFLFQP